MNKKDKAKHSGLWARDRIVTARKLLAELIGLPYLPEQADEQSQAADKLGRFIRALEELEKKAATIEIESL